MTEDRYTLGYGQDIVRAFSSRKGAREAAFFLPYLAPGMRLLDCGCGPGTITVELAAHVSPGEVVGIDLAGEQFTAGRALADDRGLANVTFEVGNIYDLEYAEESFDAVFAHGVLYHLAEPERAIAEMRRVLKSGGLLGIRDSDEGGTLFTPTGELMERAFRAVLSAQASHGAQPYFGRRQRSLLREAGFEVLQVSASYDCYATERETRGFGKVLAELILQPHIADAVVSTGSATRAEVAELSAAALAWGEDPDAFWARARCEAVARKSP